MRCQKTVLWLRCCYSNAVFTATVAQLDGVLGYEPRGRGQISGDTLPGEVGSSELFCRWMGLLQDAGEKLCYSYASFAAAVAQLDRVLGYEPRGRGFESCQPRHI